jgi:hypothetical protein
MARAGCVIRTVHIRSRLLAKPPTFTHNSRINASGGFMRVVLSRDFTLGLVLATALSGALLPTAASAYTAEEQQACSGDAFRLCSSEIPDVDRVTACMIARKAELSPGCRVFFRSGPEPVANVGAPTNIRPVAHKHVAPKASKASKPSKASKSSHRHKKPIKT